MLSGGELGGQAAKPVLSERAWQGASAFRHRGFSELVLDRHVAHDAVADARCCGRAELHGQAGNGAWLQGETEVENSRVALDGRGGCVEAVGRGLRLAVKLMFPRGAGVQAKLLRDVPVSPRTEAEAVGIHVGKFVRMVDHTHIIAVDTRPEPLSVEIDREGVRGLPDVAETEVCACVGRIEVIRGAAARGGIAQVVGMPVACHAAETEDAFKVKTLEEGFCDIDAGEQAAVRVAGVALAVNVARVEAVVRAEARGAVLEEHAARERCGGEVFSGGKAEDGGDAAYVNIGARLKALRAAGHGEERGDDEAVRPVACGQALNRILDFRGKSRPRRKQRIPARISCCPRAGVDREVLPKIRTTEAAQSRHPRKALPVALKEHGLFVGLASQKSDTRRASYYFQPFK